MRQINPLGIRKLDVQAERRSARAEAHVTVLRQAEMWGITDPEALRFAKVIFMQGWEAGVVDGSQATRDRVAEALKTGTLIKP